MFSWFLPLPPSATLGALEFSLLYDQDNSSLHCTMIKAKVSERPSWGPRGCSGMSRGLGDGLGDQACLSVTVTIDRKGQELARDVSFRRLPSGVSQGGFTELQGQNFKGRAEVCGRGLKQRGCLAAMTA